MNFKKSQSGRSMVEMLGVLAIIGVLSVGGIAGYSLAMRRHRANGVVDLISKYALLHYNKCQQEILNGEFTSVSECGSILQFEEAGLGPYPTGTRTIPYVSHKTSSDGVDIVEIDLSFSDQKLCQTVASIAGTTCEGSNVLFKIKQN